MKQQNTVIKRTAQHSPRLRSQEPAASPPTLPKTYLEEAAAILGRNLRSVLVAAGQQLRSWTLAQKQPASRNEVASLIEGSDRNPADSDNTNDVFGPSLPDMHNDSDATYWQQHQQQQQHFPAEHMQQEWHVHFPAPGWIQRKWHQFGSSYGSMLDRLQASGSRQLDGLQASVQQMVPWPQLHVQRRSALRLQIHSCHLRWPRSPSQPCLELNLTGM